MRRWRRAWLQAALLLTLALLVAGCGFRLQGYIQLPAGLQPLHIVASGNTASFGQTLQRQLQQSGITLASGAAESRLQLLLENLVSSEQQLVYGQIETYELTLSITADAISRGNPLFEHETFQAHRQYSYNRNSDSLLSRDQLRRELQESMENDLIRQLTLRIQALAHENPAQ